MSNQPKQNRMPDSGEGWYRSAPAKKYHYFTADGVPLCGATVKGFNWYIEPIQKVNVDNPDDPNQWCCVKCNAKLKSILSKAEGKQL